MTWAELHPQASNLQCSLNGPVSRGLWILCCKHGAKNDTPRNREKHVKKGEHNTKKRLPNQGLPRTYSKDPNLTKFKFALWESGSERDFCFFSMSTCLYTFYSVLHLNQCNPMQLHRTCDPAVSIMAGRSIDFDSSCVGSKCQEPRTHRIWVI